MTPAEKIAARKVGDPLAALGRQRNPADVLVEAGVVSARAAARLGIDGAERLRGDQRKPAEDGLVVVCGTNSGSGRGFTYTVARGKGEHYRARRFDWDDPTSGDTGVEAEMSRCALAAAWEEGSSRDGLCYMRIARMTPAQIAGLRLEPDDL